jgi:Endonuclease/Exonuclease/phosphatase family
MSDSIRVLTYNTQLRSWAGEVLAQQSLTPITSAEERAATIAQRILDSAEDYDVVCLNEVFDDDARAVLKGALSGKYPNAVYKADIDDVLLQIGLVAGTTLGGTLLLAVPVVGWLGAIGLAYAGLDALTNTKFEDSGLMLFSRLPFATFPVTEQMGSVLSPIGFTETQFPIVSFVPYKDGADDDALAAKGVLYARFVREDGSPLHLFAAHTQSDPTRDVGKNAGVRDGQFAQIWELVEQMVGEPPFQEEIVFCGDFNVDGAFHKKMTDPDSVSAEWRNRFATPASKFTDFLHDVWHYEQCPGFDSSGAQVLPANFDRGITIYNKYNQRLDYFVRPVGYSGRLATQHIAIAYDVAQESDPHRIQSAYTSDHLPLKIDLNRDRPRADVLRAEAIPVSISNPDVSVRGLIADGKMDWFRIDEKGGYGLRLSRAADRAAFVVYSADDLSTPVAPFTVIGDPPAGESPFGTRFALPEAPFFVRVFLLDRHSEADYELTVHRFAGTSELDAIPLPVAVTLEEEFKVGAPHSLDDPATPFSEQDAFWFVTQFDGAPDESIDVKALVVIGHLERNVFDLLVLRRDAPGEKDEVTEEPPGAEPVIARFEYRRPAGGLILVRRHDPTFQAKRFRISFFTGMNYLYGRLPNAKSPASLFCADETDGFLGNESGSDDISFNLSADGRQVIHADNVDDLQFDDDTLRDLTPWLNVVRYVNRAEFELVELDDLSADDRTSITIPPYDDVVTPTNIDAGNIAPNMSAGRAHARFKLVFDVDGGDEDGVYYLYVTVSNRPPGQQV